jgi:hypothetical protein
MALVITLVFFNKGATAMENDNNNPDDYYNPGKYTPPTTDPDNHTYENKNKDAKVDMKLELIKHEESKNTELATDKKTDALRKNLVNRWNQGYVVPQQSSESCTECQAYGIPFVLYNLMWITMLLVRKSNCIYENGEYVPEYTDADGYKTPGYYPHIYEGGNYSKNTCENLSHGALLLIAFEVFLCMCWLKAKGQ